MKVHDLKQGSFFQINEKTYHLMRLGVGSAYVKEIADGLTQTGKLYTIALSSEVDRVIGNESTAKENRILAAAKGQRAGGLSDLSSSGGSRGADLAVLEKASTKQPDGASGWQKDGGK